MKIKFSKKNYLNLTISIFVFFLSFFILPLYFSGDQLLYRRVYDSLPSYGIVDGFLYYARTLSSREFVHFILSWIASHFISKDLFISFSNALFAFVTMSLFQNWKASILISFLLILTNFYMLVLYFAAERLKFSFIFLVLSLINIDKIKRVYLFSSLAIISHVQILIIYFSILLNFLIRTASTIYKTGKVSKSFLIFLIIIIIPPIIVGYQLFDKIQHYFTPKSIIELSKTLIFLLLALWYSNKKIETLILFTPILFAVYFFGGSRINIFSYFLFLYYGLQFRKGWNLGVLSTSAYFGYASVIFLEKIYHYGNGFF